MPGEVTKKQKRLQEKKAMKSILNCLPLNVRSDYEKIWQEYFLNKTDVARFVHRTDKLEMLLQAKQYTEQGYSPRLLSQFFKSANKSLNIDTKHDFMDAILKMLQIG